MRKRVLSLCTVLALCLSLLPVPVWAAEDEDITEKTAQAVDSSNDTSEKSSVPAPELGEAKGNLDEVAQNPPMTQIDEEAELMAANDGFNLSQGNIFITEANGAVTVQQGETQKTVQNSNGIVITQSSSESTENYIEILSGSVSLTIRNLNVRSKGAPIELKPGAKLSMELAGDNVLTALGPDVSQNTSVPYRRLTTAGICVPYNAELIVRGNGTLTATGAKGGAGIGGGGYYVQDGSCGKITIESGTINAIGSRTVSDDCFGAGIGGAGNNGGIVQITGGTVVATGSGNYSDGGSAGIGGGCREGMESQGESIFQSYGCDGGILIVTGGTVTATGAGAGIGGGAGTGKGGNGGRVTVTGGTVNAASTCGGTGIGGGAYCGKWGLDFFSGSGGGPVIISGGVINIADNEESPDWTSRIGGGYWYNELLETEYDGMTYNGKGGYGAGCNRISISSNATVSCDEIDGTRIDKWKSNIRYDANGGTGTMSNVTVDDGLLYTLLENKFTPPAGKSFQAWSVGEQEYTPGDLCYIADDTVVKAVWQEGASYSEDSSEYRIGLFNVQKMGETYDPDSPTITHVNKGDVIVLSFGIKNNADNVLSSVGVISALLSLSYDGSIVSPYTGKAPFEEHFCAYEKRWSEQSTNDLYPNYIVTLAARPATSPLKLKAGQEAVLIRVAFTVLQENGTAQFESQFGVSGGIETGDLDGSVVTTTLSIGSTPAPSVPVTGISLNKTELSLNADSSANLIATVFPYNASDKSVTWSSSDTSVATVSFVNSTLSWNPLDNSELLVSSSGKVVAKKAGTATITAASSDGKTVATCSVTVTASIKVISVNLNKSALSLTTGSSEKLTATVSPSDATNTSVKWSSSDTSIATVSSYGTVKAKKAGTATITVTTVDGSKTASCVVTVTDPIAVTGVTLDKTSLLLKTGASEKLTATILPSDATKQSVKWTSSDTSIATVSTSGKVSGKANGTATITVTTVDGNKTATCTVTVADSIAVTGVSLNKTAMSLGVGASETLVATISPSNATNKSVTWSSSDTSVATVSSRSGKVTAKKTGSATITATTADGGKIAICTVTVEATAVTGVSLNKNTLSLNIGDSESLTATIAPSNASNKSVTWTSSDTSVATVSTSGKIDAKAAGSSTITVKTTDGGKTAACTVTVFPIAVTAVDLNKTTLSLNIGSSENLVATVSPANATNQSVTWSSSDTSIVTVSSSGKVTRKAAGTATITVTTVDGGKTAICTVTAPQSNTPQITVSGANASKGHTVDIPVIIQNNPGISGATLTVSYDKSVLSLNSIIKGAVFENGNYTAYPDTGVILWYHTENVTDNGTMFTLQFTVNESAQDGSYNIVVGLRDGIPANLSNANSNIVSAEFISGILTVASGIRGDVTGDSVIAINDVVKLARSVAGNITLTAQEQGLADVTGDGIVAINDVVKLARYVAGNIASLQNAEVALLSGDTSAVIEVATVSGNPGETVRVPVSITSNPGIAGAQLDILFDDNLTLKNIIRGDVLSVGTFNPDVSNGRIQWYYDQANVTDTGVLFTLEFDVSDSAENGDAYAVTVNVKDGVTANLSDYDFDIVSAEFKSGKVQIGEAADTVINKVNRNGNTVTAEIICADISATAFCGIYNNNGQFVTVSSREISGASTYNFQFNGFQFDYAKVFLLDSSQRPLCESKKS